MIKIFNKKPNSSSSTQLKEGTHYYIEKGLYVFTEKYHLERGYCCESGCRHCPFGFIKKSTPKTNLE